MFTKLGFLLAVVWCCGNFLSTVALAQGTSPLPPPPRWNVPPPVVQPAPTDQAQPPPQAPPDLPPSPSPSAPLPGDQTPPPPVPVSPPSIQPAPPAPPVSVSSPASGHRVHDRFYLRLNLGLGGLGSSASTDGRKQEISGGTLALGAAAGWTVAKNLIVFGELFVFSAGKPTWKLNGADQSQSPNVGPANLHGLGVGVVYYFQPINIFVLGSLALAQFQLEDGDGNTRYQSEGGLGLHLMVGKEWWVSSEWGIGLAAQLLTSSAKDKTLEDATWGSAALGLALVATYN